MNFLEKLDFLMVKYGLNKRTLSQKSDIPYTTIDAWYKKGYEGLKLTTLRKLNDFFNTSLDFWILDEITDPNYGKSNGFTVDYDEMELIKKYRFVTEHSPEGAKTVTYVLDREHAIAERMAKLEKDEQKYTKPLEVHPEGDKQQKALETQNAAYAELNVDDISAMEKGRDLLWAQALGLGEKAIKTAIGNSADKSKTASHSHPDTTAQENGKIKMFKPGKKM